MAQRVRVEDTVPRFSSITVLLMALLATDVVAATLMPSDIVVMDNQVMRLMKIDPLTGGRTLISGCTQSCSTVLGAGDNFTSQTSIGVVVEPGGSVLVTDRAATWLLIRVDPGTGDRTVLASPSAGSGPTMTAISGIVVKPNGEIYAAANDNGFDYFIVRIDPSTGDRTIVADPSGSGVLDALALDADGTLVVGTGFGEELLRVDPATGDVTVISDQFSPGPSYGYISDLVIEDDGDIVVASWSEGLIRTDPITGARTVVSDASTGSGPNFQVATGLGLESGGNLLVGDQSARILRVDPANGDRTVLSDSSSSGISLSYPRGVDVVLQPAVPVPSMGLKGLLLLTGLLIAAATMTVPSIVKRAEGASH